MNVSKKFFFILLSGSLVILIHFLFSPHQVLIESFESKTAKGKEVFNKISLETKGDMDIWSMQQSHEGVHSKNWDDLKIIVNKKNNTVSFHQLENGKDIDFKVSCFLCHSNGPRAIRPNYESTQVSYSLKDKINIGVWNMKIKTYGVLKLTQDNKKRMTPLKWQSTHQNQALEIKTCSQCHKEDGFFSRGKLLRQHFMSIKFLVKNKQMPPWPYKLSDIEQKQLKKFLMGF